MNLIELREPQVNDILQALNRKKTALEARLDRYIAFMSEYRSEDSHPLSLWDPVLCSIGIGFRFLFRLY